MNSNLLVVVDDGGTGLSLKPQTTMGNYCANITADTPEIWSQDPNVCEDEQLLRHLFPSL